MACEMEKLLIFTAKTTKAPGRLLDMAKTSAHSHQPLLRGGWAWAWLLWGLCLPGWAVAQPFSQAREDSLALLISQAQGPRRIRLTLELAAEQSRDSIDKAIGTVLLALEGAQVRNLDSLVLECQLQHARYLFMADKFDDALRYAQALLEDATRANDRHTQASAHNLIGAIHNRNGRLHLSLESFLESIRVFEDLGDWERVADLRNNIGTTQIVLGNYELARTYIGISLEWYLEAGQDEGISFCYNNLGESYWKQARLDSALHFFRLAEQVKRRHGAGRELALTLGNIGHTLLAMGQADSAAVYLLEAKSISKRFASPSSLALAHLGFAQMRASAGELAQAKAELDSCVAIAEEIGYHDIQLGAYLEQTEIFERLGRDSQALASFRLYHSLRDSLVSQHKQQQVEEFQMRYESERKQNQEIMQGQEDNLALRRYMLALGLVLASVLFLFFKRYREIKAKDEMLKETIRKNEAFIEAIPYMYFTIDAGGTYLDFKSARSGRVGSRGGELIGKNIRQVKGLDPENLDLFLRMIERTLRTRQPQKFGYVFRNQGELLHYESYLAMLNPSTVLAIVHDVTQRTQAEQKLKDISEQVKAQNEGLQQKNKALVEAMNKAAESDRLKTTFLQNISHELRTPLNSILGFSELLNLDRMDPEKRRNITKSIKKSSHRFLGIINDIIDISKIETGQMAIQPEDFNINVLLRELEAELGQLRQEKPASEVELSLEQTLRPELAEVHADRDRIGQVLRNLLDNALKFTQEGRVQFGCRRDGQHLLFFVKDSGIGIPKHMQVAIFERFRQVDESSTRRYGGNGLGLAICKGLVLLMKGNLWLESEPDKGSTFYFTVPYLLPRGEDTEELGMPAQPGRHWQGRRVLVVEDEQENFNLLESLLELEKATCLRASNGLEAVELCRADGALDLVLMDIGLPQMNGIDATAAIKAFRPKLPIVAQTAFGMTQDKVRCMKAGCDDFIAKPINRLQFRQVVGRFLGELPVDFED